MVSAKHAARYPMDIGSHGINNLNIVIGSQINLIAAQNIDTLKSKNSGSSASLGISFGTDGLLFTAGASGSKGKTKGNGSTWTETQIQSGNDAGDKVTLESGSDTNIIGSQVIGNQVIANVGTSGAGNLNIQSLQDTNQYKDKQQSIGGSISVGYGKMGGSFNYSDSKTKSNYASVNEQAGFFAGNGGFQANVAGNTKLTGAVMASTDQAVKQTLNSLTTQTLTITNVENKAEYKASSMSMSAGVGTHTNDKGEVKSSPSGSAGMASDSDKASSITVSGISGAAVSITDNTQQQTLTGQDTATTVATLNRDVHTQISTDADGNTTAIAEDSNGNNLANTITPIFDKEKVERELQAAVTITQAFSQVAPKAVGDYASSKLNEANNKLTQANDLTNGLNDEQRLNLISEANDLNNAWGETGYARVALHTAIGGLTGNFEGAVGAASTALTIPIIAEQINKLAVPAEVKQALIMGAGTIIGSATGGTAVAGGGLKSGSE